LTSGGTTTNLWLNRFMLPSLIKNAVPLLLTVFAGALLPAQFATNSALANHLHSVILTGAISYSVGSLLLIILVTLQRKSPDWAAARQAPFWSWFGGAIGSAYVVGSVLLTQALGAAIATTLVIASQIVTAILLDHFGALGLPKRPINRVRLMAVILVFLSLGIRLWEASEYPSGIRNYRCRFRACGWASF
jgi:bacterial/archaeal transporter family-2 protein